MEKGILASAAAVVASWIIHLIRLRRATPDDNTVRRISPALIGKLPKHCMTAGGEKNDPINVLLLADESEILPAFTSAGWVVADRHTPRTTLMAFCALVLNLKYSHGPFTPLLVNAKPQMFSLQKPHRGKGFRYRHHLRIWPSTHRVGHKRLWLVAASNEIGIHFTPRPMFINHTLDPDLDSERDRIAADLQAYGAKQIGRYQMVAAGEHKTAFDETYHSDGEAVLLELSHVA